MGIYFLEIIVVFCYDFRREPWEKNYDFSSLCVEDPFYHRLTKDGTKIFVTRNSSKLPGHWVYTGGNHFSYHPLYTRFQPRGCYDKQIRYTHACNPPSSSLVPFQNYSFEFSFDESNLFKGERGITICLLGASHTRMMYETLNNTLGIYNSLPEFVYEDVRMPFQVTGRLIKQMLERHHCSAFVIAVGQWPAGKRFRINNRSPTLFGTYQDEIRNMLNRILATCPHIPVYLRSINYNPLGSLIVGCPPADWRSPTVIDGYNAIIEHAVRDVGSANITYLDANFLVGPMWDSAEDWCHLSQKVRTAHAIHIVAIVLQGIASKR